MYVWIASLLNIWEKQENGNDSVFLVGQIIPANGLSHDYNTLTNTAKPGIYTIIYVCIIIFVLLKLYKYGCEWFYLIIYFSFINNYFFFCIINIWTCNCYGFPLMYLMYSNSFFKKIFFFGNRPKNPIKNGDLDSWHSKK